MINNLERMNLFPVQVHKATPNLDHMIIADYTISQSKFWERYTTYNDPEANNRWLTRLPQRKLLEQSIIDFADEYLKQTNRPVRHKKSNLMLWANVYNQHVSHDLHNHANALLSGIYYPQADTNSSPLIYHSPWEKLLMYDYFLLENGSSHFAIYPKSGDMLIWPSWLDHRMPTQGASDIQRISIPFNITYL